MYDVISFDKFRARMLEHGVYDVKCDATSVTFILKNGEVYEIYSSEEEVAYAVSNDWAFIQSDLCIMQKVEP